MTSEPRKTYWVFFDTATRREYYSDVHRVLALPPGSLLEYQYRDGRVDPLALPAVRQRALISDRALFLYAQRADYRRGDPDPDDTTAPDDLIWQAMRLGRLIASWKAGEHNHFQFRLEGYPNPDPHMLGPLLDDLLSRNATPFNRWVSHCDREEVLGALHSYDDVAAWQEIVSRLSTNPMQFVGDTFWRIDAPRRTRFRTGKELPSKYTGRQGHDEAFDHRYVVAENCAFGLRVHTHEPHGAPPRGTGTALPKLKVATAQGGPILAPHPEEVELRRNAEFTIPLESKHSADTERRLGSLSLTSSDSFGPGVPGGLSLEFYMRLSRWKRGIGVLVMFVGAALVALAGVLRLDKTISLELLIVLGVGGLVMLGIGQRLYSGKWAFKT